MIYDEKTYLILIYVILGSFMHPSANHRCDHLLEGFGATRNGIKAASTPATYCPPNFKNPGAQTATIDDTPEATKEQKHELTFISSLRL